MAERGHPIPAMRAGLLNPSDWVTLTFMPRVHEVDGFKVYIYLPPGEHGPAHVHVLKAGGEVVVQIGTGVALEPYRVFGPMRDADALRAVRIVEAVEDYLLEEWRRHHGD